MADDRVSLLWLSLGSGEGGRCYETHWNTYHHLFFHTYMLELLGRKREV